MSDERQEILQMLSEGRIDVDGAERLLIALEEGRRRRELEERPAAGRKQQAVHDALASVKQTVAGIGPMIGRIAGEISGEFQKERPFPGELDAEQLPLLPHEGGVFEVEEGAKLFLRNDKEGGPGGGDLVLVGGDGPDCEVEGDLASNLRIMKSSSGPVIRWAGGFLKVTVPATVAGVFVHALGGDADLSGLRCPLQVKSTGGDLRLADLKRGFKVKTMGGNIRVLLRAECSDECEAKTMGGNIRIDVEDGTWGTRTEAIALGGSIAVDETLGLIEKSGRLGRQVAQLQLGEGEAFASLLCKTMGGNIEIRRANDVQ